ncbi:hypothetical protein [Leuconostoc citreum]
MSEEVKVLEMRTLNGADLFPMLAIIGKLNIKDEVVKLFDGGYSSQIDESKLIGLSDEEQEALKKEEADQQGKVVAAELLQVLLQNIGFVKNDINQLLANLTGKKPATIETLSLSEYTALLIEFAKKPELIDFFKSVGSLM